MTRLLRIRILAAVAAGATALLLAVTAAAPAQSEPEPLDVSELYIEVNATDGDIGLHGKIDGEDWRVMRLYGPDGGKLMKIQAKSGVKDQGLTEVFFESAEPEFDELSVDEFKARFPAGEYTFRGETIEGDPLEGTATLTHDIPDGPVIVSPTEDEVVDTAAVEIVWEPVDNVDIAGYQVAVSQENDVERTYQVDMPADATSLRVPEEFFEEGLDTKVEVLAREVSGNQTGTEVPFSLG